MRAFDLINTFNEMLVKKWGYVPGTAGELWTEEKAAKQGHNKWIGHRVADCSGAFVYAFKKAGISVYHGSNRLARVYTKQLLSIDEAVPGMIVFKGRLPGTEHYSLPVDYKPSGKYYNGDTTDYYHCGLCVDGGMVINLQSSSTGCVASPISQWSCCGYLKNVDYDNSVAITEDIKIPYAMAKELYAILKDGLNGK